MSDSLQVKRLEKLRTYKYMKTSVFLVLFCVGSIAVAKNICSEPNLAKLVNAGSPAFSKTEFKKSIVESKVTIVGEIHFYTDSKPRLDFIKEFSMNAIGKKCVAYEWAKSDFDFVEFMNKIKQKLDEVQKPEYAQANPQIRPDQLKELVGALGQIYNYYWPMAELTRHLGMKAVMVDHKDHNLETEKSIDERNAAMAENLKVLLDSGECDSILFFVGKAHLAKNTEGSVTRVQDLVRNLNIKTSTINLQMTRETLPLAVQSWSICPFAPPVEDYTFFKNSDLSDNYPLLPYMRDDFTGWKDFDFTLLAP